MNVVNGEDAMGYETGIQFQLMPYILENPLYRSQMAVVMLVISNPNACFIRSWPVDVRTSAKSRVRMSVSDGLGPHEYALLRHSALSIRPPKAYQNYLKDGASTGRCLASR